MKHRNQKRYHIDLHVHTKRYSPCAELLDPDQLGDVMRARGLAGVVMTEHDIMWRKEEIAALSDKLNGLKVYRGVEISSSMGHLIVIGLNDLNGIRPGINVSKVIERARACGAVIILAHHHLVYPQMNYLFDIRSFPPDIDAIEIASTMTFGQNRIAAMEIAEKMNWQAVAGSDAHFLGNVGKAFTTFTELPADERQLSAAIRHGKGVPATIKPDLA